MKSYKSIWILAVALVGAILFLAPLPASAQSCALCYTQAASSGARMIQALKSGILVLIAPPTLMSVGVIFVCYRKRNQTMRDAANESERDWKTDDAEDSDKNW
jgi:cbb3-type cytochrome oxidase subunit 3